MAQVQREPERQPEEKPQLREVEPLQTKRTAEFVLGLIGGIFAIIGGILAMIVGAAGAAVEAPEGGSVILLGIAALILGALGIVGASYVKSKPKTGGGLMIISALGGLLAISGFYIPAAILLMIAGLMGVFRK